MDVYHAGVGVLLAVQRLFDAQHVKIRSVRAGVMYAPSVADVHHTGLSMFLAIPRCLVAVVIEAGVLQARGI